MMSEDDIRKRIDELLSVEEELLTGFHRTVGMRMALQEVLTPPLDVKDVVSAIENAVGEAGKTPASPPGKG